MPREKENMQPKLAAEFIEIGRQLSASKQIVMEKFIEDAKSKSENLINAQREAATLFFSYVQHCTEYSPASARQYVRIYERFGDSAHRPQLERLFNIGELAVLAACTDDVLEEAIALKKANPGLTRNELRKYLQERNPR
jgi:hypothetical protein